MNEILSSNCDNYCKHIVTPITPYLLCDHHFSTEIYENDKKYIGLDIKTLCTNAPNDLYKHNNFNKINRGDIVLVQVDLFEVFIDNILPKVPSSIVLITSQWHYPQIHRSITSDKCISNNKIILWISQNPIYENHRKYMAFPYGICHLSVNNYMGFIKTNDVATVRKDKHVYNSHISIPGNLPTDHIRRHPIFEPVNGHLPYDEYLNEILRSKFTISPTGDRDDCYRHYECIGLNSIPISNTNYREIFENNMISLNIDDIIRIIK